MFADTTILRDFPFGKNQPVKSADNLYIRILKKKKVALDEIKKSEDQIYWFKLSDWVTEPAAIFVCT